MGRRFTSSASSRRPTRRSTICCDAFQTDAKPIDAACFAVAGPVFESRAEVTNTGWTMARTALASAFSIGRVALINDFYAVALGVPLLAPADLVSLNAGTRVDKAPIAILGAGTGLGEAILVHDGAQCITSMPREGGHADFAPQDEEQAGSSSRCSRSTAT